MCTTTLILYLEVMAIKQTQNKITYIINDPNQPKELEQQLRAIILAKVLNAHSSR